MTAPPPFERHKLRASAMRTLNRRQQSSLVLWQSLALALGKIIGELGFESLFFRCVYQSQARYPWLASNGDAKAIDHLAACLATRDPAQAEQASLELLSLFTDTLILLIGELVTNRILLAAWGTLAVDDVPEPPQ
jgi:hypothetical protein